MTSPILCVLYEAQGSNFGLPKCRSPDLLYRFSVSICIKATFNRSGFFYESLCVKILQVPNRHLFSSYAQHYESECDTIAQYWMTTIADIQLRLY
jgi:hypothetical protein